MLYICYLPTCGGAAWCIKTLPLRGEGGCGCYKAESIDILLFSRFQWLCKGCGKRLPIRTGTFFFRLQCSILQALQIILAWCEDADVNTAAQFFGNYIIIIF